MEMNDSIRLFKKKNQNKKEEKLKKQNKNTSKIFSKSHGDQLSVY